MPASAKVSGGPETARAFGQLEKDVADLSATHGKVALARLGGVRSRTPVLSGQLAGSWGSSGSASVASITSPLVYAGPIEYGSEVRGISAVRMVAETLEAEEAELLAEYEAAILERAKARGFRLA